MMSLLLGSVSSAAISAASTPDPTSSFLEIFPRIYGTGSSSSAFATKGEVFTAVEDFEVASVIWLQDNLAPAIDVVVAILSDVTTPSSITRLRRQSAPSVQPNSFNEVILNTPFSVSAGEHVYIAVSRTDGSGTQNVDVTFGGVIDGSLASYVSHPGVDRGARIASSDLQVGTQVTDFPSGPWSVSFRRVAPVRTVALIGITGQSNSIGRAGPVDSVLDAPQNNIRMYEELSADKIALATDPLDHFNENPNQIGYGLSLAKSLISSIPQDDILLVGMGQGGSGFINDQWNAGGASTIYNAAKARWQAALNWAVDLYGAENVSVYGFVWTQGEDEISDFPSEFSGSDDNARFAAMPMSMWDGVRQTWSGVSPDTPVVITSVPSAPGLTANAAAYANVQAGLSSIPTKLPYSAFVDGADLSSVDSLHWDAASLRTLGSRIAAAFPSAISNNLSPVYPAFSPSPSNVETAISFDFAGMGDDPLVRPNAPVSAVEFDNRRMKITNGVMIFDSRTEVRWRNSSTKPKLLNRDFLLKVRIRESMTERGGIIADFTSTGNQRSWLLRTFSGSFQFFVSGDGVSTELTLSSARNSGQWYDVEVQRAGDSIVMRLDGNQVSSHTLPTGFSFFDTGGSALHIGDYDSGFNLTGEIERISLEFLS